VVSGEIDHASCDIVREGFVNAMHDRRVTVIDLSGVTFFSAAGITLLIEFAFHHRAEVIGNPMIARVLTIVSCLYLLTDVVDPSAEDTATPLAATA